MTLEEKIKVMEHYKNGGEIQYCFNHIKIWIDANNPDWDWNRCSYRIKEQSNIQIELIPFDITHDLVGQCIIKNNTPNQFLIIGKNEVGIRICDGFLRYYDLMKLYSFPDGTPCGQIP